MADCKWCHRSGWFLGVNEHGLCKNCTPAIALEVSSRGRVINDSINLVQSTKKLDTALSRCDVIIQHAQALKPYEDAGIVAINPPPSVLIHQYREKKDVLIGRHLEEEFQDALSKAALTPSYKTKVSLFSKLLLRARDYRAWTSDPRSLDSLERRVADKVHVIQLEGYLEQAKRLEFKGNKKKALDAYYDALYFLRHDDIDDATQTEHIKHLEQKILELGGRLEGGP